MQILTMPVNFSITVTLSNSSAAIGARIMGRYALLNLAAPLLVGINRYQVQIQKQVIRPIPQGKLIKDLEYAQLAKAAYDPETPALPQGWNLVKPFRNDATGYKAGLFEKGNELVLAFAGTEEIKVVDWPIGGIDMLANITQGLFRTSLQYQRAVEDAEFVINANPGKTIRFVGHSLGGGLASVAALTHGVKATTFNSAGVHDSTQFNGGIANAGQLIDAYRIQGEILSTLQDLPADNMGFGALGHLGYGHGFYAIGLIGALAASMPDSIGKAYWLQPQTWDPFDLHTQTQVINSMERAIK